MQIETQPCILCGQRSTLQVDPIAYQAWYDGAFLQDAFRGLPAEQRELLTTGTHSVCWDLMFKDS